MKIKKAVALFLAIILSVSVLAGCSSEPLHAKVFSREGISITLDQSYSLRAVEGVAVCYKNKTNMVALLKEDFDEFTDMGVPTLKEYTQIIIDNNYSDAKMIEEDGLFAFIIEEKIVEGKKMSYFVACYEEDGVFWIAQIGCAKNKFQKQKENFKKYAKSVVLTDPFAEVQETSA